MGKIRWKKVKLLLIFMVMFFSMFVPNEIKTTSHVEKIDLIIVPVFTMTMSIIILKLFGSQINISMQKYFSSSSEVVIFIGLLFMAQFIIPTIVNCFHRTKFCLEGLLALTGGIGVVLGAIIYILLNRSRVPGD